MSDLFCGACGTARSGSVPFCGRCGFRFDATSAEPVAVGADDLGATRNRASLHAAQPPRVAEPVAAPVAAQAFPPPPPPPVGGWPPPEPMVEPLLPQGEQRTAPPVLWFVAAGLVVLAALIVYPVAQFTPDLIGTAFGGEGFSRAFATLLLQFVVMFWAAGLALVALAVGLVRGSRVAQILTTVLAGITALSQLVSLSAPDEYGIRPDDGVIALIVLGALAVIALVALPPTVRAFFAADPRPVGVSLAATSNVYLGGVALLDAALFCLAGIAGVEYVWLGLAFAAVGAVLVVTSRGLHEGSQAARSVTLGVYGVLVIAVIWFGIDRDQLADFPTLLPLGIVVAGIVGLTGPQTSRRHFTGPVTSVPLRGPAVVASSVALLLVVVCAVVGFHAAATGSGA